MKFLCDTVRERNGYGEVSGKMDLLYRGNTDSYSFGISGGIHKK